MRPVFTVEVAIVLGAALIAAAIFFGLRSGREEPSLGTTASLRDPPSNPALPLSASPRPPSSTPSTVDRGLLKAQLERSLAAQKPHLVEVCWRPSAARDPQPKEAHYQLFLTFDAQGKQIARGIGEPREARREGITQCIQRELPNLDIGPQVVSVDLEVGLDLP